MKKSCGRKKQAEELIRQMEAKRAEYERTGRSLTRYALVPFASEEMLTTYPVLVMGGLCAIILLIFLELDGSVWKGRLEFLGLLVAMIAVVCVGAYYAIMAHKHRGKNEAMISWSVSSVDFLEHEYAIIQSGLERYASQLAEAQPWIEAIKRVEPVITEELKFGLTLVEKLDCFEAQIYADECLVQSFGISREGYEDLVLWLLDERKERAKRQELIREFESTL